MRRAIPLSLALLTGFVCAAPAMSRQAPESELSRIQAEYRDETVRARRLRADADALQQQPLQNSFLVSGCLHGPAATAGLYPDAELSRDLAQCWLEYFLTLGQLLQHKQLAERIKEV